MNFFAVTGNPIFFSKSPNLFNYFFDKENIEAKYFRLAADSAEEAINLFNELGLSGMNVTAPFKTDIIQYLDKIDDLASQIGSVNTIVKKGSKLIGYNTDYYGITNTLKDVKDKNIIVLGAGGAAKAAIFALIKNNANVTVYNRTKSNAKELIDKYNINFCDETNLKIEVAKADIIINTLPHGIKIIDDELINENHIIFDTIYDNSVYQDIAKEKNITFFDGKHWLLNQALASFEHFFNKKINFNIDIFDKMPKSKEKLIFIGFMGSGKTSISEAIGAKLNYKLFCTDKIISSKESKSINDIFEEKGEPYFRQVEQDILTMLSNMDGKAIISTGGGIILNETNRKLIKDNYTAIWLYANTESIMSRTKPENRPLLKNNFTKEFVAKLMEIRKIYYLESADLIINTNHKSIEEISDKLLLSELKNINN